MLSQMVGETPYDLRWRMFGIHVRVHPLFWVGAAAVCWDWLHFGIAHLLVAMACVFFSILLHEMGHVLMGRVFGTHGDIILWAFGGLAVHSADVRRRWQRIAVLLAGPGIQLVLWGLLRLALEYSPLPPHSPWAAPTLLETMVDWLLWINLYWALLNLLPIWPLDGGQITRELLGAVTPRNAVRLSLQLSIGLAALLALYGFLTENNPPLVPYVPTGIRSGIFFLIFAGIGIQALQIEYAQRRSFDPWDYHERW